jgi:LysR family glycine cleavage system transcriptional activator
LNALCAFEAAARLGSTVAAGRELGVTHGAISKQVALLEAWLELALFERTGGRLLPTQAGARFAAALGRALDGIDRSTRDLAESASAAATVIRVSTTASFAALWLLPRLATFAAKHPDYEVWVAETRALVGVGRDHEADLALRMGRGPWPGVRAEPLMTDHLIPVCAPALAERLRRPADLARARLLHDDERGASWADWLEAAGAGRPRWSERGPRLADSALLLQAVADGHGVALIRRRLAAARLKTGAVVQPFGPAVPLGITYWLILPPRGTPVSRATRAFARWIRDGTRE